MPTVGPEAMQPLGRAGLGFLQPSRPFSSSWPPVEGSSPVVGTLHAQEQHSCIIS